MSILKKRNETITSHTCFTSTIDGLVNKMQHLQSDRAMTSKYREGYSKPYQAVCSRGILMSYWNRSVLGRMKSNTEFLLLTATHSMDL